MLPGFSHHLAQQIMDHLVTRQFIDGRADSQMERLTEDIRQVILAAVDSPEFNPPPTDTDDLAALRSDVEELAFRVGELENN